MSSDPFLSEDTYKEEYGESLSLDLLLREVQSNVVVLWSTRPTSYSFR